MKNKHLIVCISLIALLVVSFFMVTVSAAEPLPDGLSWSLESSSATSEPVPGDVNISIQHPSGWFTKETDILITVTADQVTRITKVKAKINHDGSWQDITDKQVITISDNCTIYVEATDKNGNTYGKSEYIECFDREAPTVRARLDGNLVRIEANDNLSGIAAIFVNGYKFTSEIVNDTLDIRLQEYDDYFEEITIQAMDNAGNKSVMSTLKNPLYVDPDAPVVDTAATPPTSATGTVTEETTSGGGTVTESATPENGETEQGTYTTSQKEFYTISTKSGKIFYLIVDLGKDSDNVYLLTEVSENDLLNFTEAGTREVEEPDYNLGENEHALPHPNEVAQEQEPEEPDNTGNETGKDSETEITDDTEPEPEKKESGSGGLLIVLLIAVAGVAGGYYYFKIYKPKLELAEADDLEDFDFEDDESVTGDFDDPFGDKVEDFE